MHQQKELKKNFKFYLKIEDYINYSLTQYGLGYYLPTRGRTMMR